jgi:hypothetical protein
MRRAAPILASLLLLGCRAAPPAPDGEGEHVKELEARVAWLEAQVKASTFVEDELLSLEVEHAGLLSTYAPDHPAVLDVERRIRGVESVRALEGHARREAMRRRLETERDLLLRQYTPDHPKVQVLDAELAYLASAPG